MALITGDQVFCHMVGDYLLQSDYMANNKTKSSVVAASHAFFYSLPFLFLLPSLPAFVVIMVSHFFIDRFRLARYAVWAKEGFGELTPTGYSKEKEPWMAVWLLIIADNILHVAINGIALKFL